MIGAIHLFFTSLKYIYWVATLVQTLFQVLNIQQFDSKCCDHTEPEVTTVLDRVDVQNYLLTNIN